VEEEEEEEEYIHIYAGQGARGRRRPAATVVEDEWRLGSRGRPAG
jgi:hypothetical protein